jgi:hypothetical protein
MEIQNNSFIRHPFFWIIFITISLLLGIFSYLYFPRAFPLLDLNITMNKEQALDKARQIACTYELGPHGFDQAAYFNSETYVQDYVELKMGGKTTFQKIIQEGLYHPYTWQVRHFKEGVVNETLIKLTPDGKPWGFIERISEDEPGAHLTPEEAQDKAERFICSKWHFNLDQYHLIETSHEVQPSSRIDYMFVYEHTTIHLGEAHYRLAVTVSGDKVTKLNHFIDIPESFPRMFIQMRSANDTIAAYAQGAIYLLYLFGGCFIGLLFLLKNNWLLPVPAIIAGIFISAIQTIARLNQLPLIWFYYDTAYSAHTFLTQHIINILISFFAWAAVYTVSLMVAEGLGRRAFGFHLQLWRSWETPIASSYTMVGNTFGGYLFVVLNLAFVIIFYLIGHTFLGWWSPSSTLIDPNILSTYVPSIGALSRALSAGVWEECLFRAIPLAGCALLGVYTGHRKKGIIIGFILQALIFGAAHADYPAQPAYVRLLELIIPSFSFGALYLAFGLMPGIIIHCLYDALLFALPIFISTAPGMTSQKVIVILGMAAPLLITAVKYNKNRALLEVPDNALNQAWQPPILHSNPPPIHDEVQKYHSPAPLSKKTQLRSLILGLVGAFIWIMITTVRPTVIPSLHLSKQEAIQKASYVLKDQAIVLDTQWSPVAQVCTTAKDTERFIVQAGGIPLYKKLLGTYIATPGWHVRFTNSDADILKRAEEYHVFINHDGSLRRTRHILPESQSGASLSEAHARTVVHQFIKATFNLAPESLKEVSARATKQPSRQDWIFVFADPGVSLTYGQARIGIEIAGDTVIDSSQYIYIPEEWFHQERHKEPTTYLIDILRSLCGIVILVLASGQAAYLFKHNLLSLLIPLLLASIYGVITLAQHIASIPDMISTFNTSQTFLSQWIKSSLATCIGIGIESVSVGLLAAVTYTTMPSYYSLNKYREWYRALALGFSWAGIIALMELIVYPAHLVQPVFIGANAYVPTITYAGYYITLYIKQALFLLFLAQWASSHSIWYRILALGLATLILTPYPSWGSLFGWILMVITTFIVLYFIYSYVISYDPLITPLLVATPSLLTLIINMKTYPYPGAVETNIITFILITISALILTNLFRPSPITSYRTFATTGN